MSIERGEPYQILKQGRISALSSKYRLAKNRINFTNCEEFLSLEKTWKKYSSKYRESVRESQADFRFISKAEGPMSKQFLSRFFIKLHQLGYTISKRIHSEKEGYLDEFNTILNIAGSTLRDFFEIHYPLPRNAKYNYEIKSKEQVIPIHEGLPSLDFAEIVRSHLQELSFIMFKHNVPRSMIKNYVTRFLLDSMKVCDWIYAGGRPGVNSKSIDKSKKYISHEIYQQPRDLDKVLSKYKNIIVNEHFVIGRKLAVRDEIYDYFTSENNYQVDHTTFNNQNDGENQKSKESDEDRLNRFLIDQGIPNRYHRFFNQNAVDKLIETRNTHARINGSQFHELALAGLPSPFNLKEAIRNGDKFLQYKHYLNNDLLVITEVGMFNSEIKGKADLIVLKKIHGDMWLPIYVFDIKTKFAYEWDFVGKKSRSNKNRITPEFNIKLEELSLDDWEIFRRRKLQKSEELQLKRYADIILDNVQDVIERILGQNYLSDYKLGYGIIRVAPTSKVENWQEWQPIILELIDQIVQRTIATNTSVFDIKPISNIIIPKNNSSKISMVIAETAKLGTKHYEAQEVIEYSKEKLPSIETEKYNIDTIKNKKLTLYLYADAPTSAGTSAAWIAAYHHLIPFVLKKHRTKQICLVNLSGNLLKFAKRRLRVGDKQFTQQILSQIDIISLQDFKKKETVSKYGVFIFSGWESYKLQMNVTGKQKSSSEAREISELMEYIPNGSKVYWMESAKPSEFHSQIYKTRTIKPPSSYSNYESLFSKVILNLPTPPAKSHHKNPEFESQRVILYWNGSDQFIDAPSPRGIIKEDIVSIISLRGHTSKFHNKNPPKQISKSDRRLINNNNLRKKIINKAYDLVPWLAQIKWPENKNNIEYEAKDLDIIDSRENRYSQFRKEPKIPSFTVKSRLNLQYKPRRITRAQIPKTLITDAMVRKIQKKYAKVKKQASYYPVNRSLLKLKSGNRLNSSNLLSLDIKNASKSDILTFGTLEYREIQRLDSMVSYVLDNDDTINKDTNEGWQEFKNLCEEIKIAIKSNQGCHAIKRIIELWEIGTGIFPDALIDELHKLQYNTYYWYINNNRIVSESVRNDSELFKYIGNTNYLIILSMVGYFKYIPKYLLRSLWWKLVSYTLTMLGFEPMTSQVPITRYQTNIVWNKVYRWMTYHIAKQEFDPLQSQMKDDLFNGFFVSKDRYGILHFNGLDEILVDLPSRNYFGPSDIPYNRVIEPKVIEEQIDTFSDSKSYLTHDLQVKIYSYENSNYIFYQDQSTGTWNLIGEIQFLLSIPETNKSSTIKEIASHKQVIISNQKRLILANDPQFNLDLIIYFKIRRSNYDTNYFEPIVDDFIELDITKEEILIEDNFNLPEIEADSVGIKFSFNYGKGIIYLKIYTKDQINSSDDSIVFEDPLDEQEFFDVHNMIQFLRSLKSTYYEIEDQSYYIDTNNDIDWGGWIHLKHQVNSYRSIGPVVFPRDVKMFLKKYMEILHYNHDDIVCALFNLYHDDEICPIHNLDYEMILESVKKAQKQFGYAQAYQIDHTGCFYLVLENEDELVNEMVTEGVMGIIKRFEEINDTEEIYDIFTKSIFHVEEAEIAVTCTLNFTEPDVSGEDYWLRRLAKEVSSSSLKWSPKGSDYIGNETYEIESASTTAEKVSSVVITYFFPASGKKHSNTIPGNADPCIRTINMTMDLDSERDNYKGVGEFEEHPEIIDLRKEIELHYPCESPLHEVGENDEEHLVMADLILNIPRSIQGNFSVELVYRTLSGQYLADHPTKEFEDWGGLYSWIDTSVIPELVKNGMGQSTIIMLDDFGEKFPSVFQEDIFGALEGIINEFDNWMSDNVEKYQDEITEFENTSDDDEAEFEYLQEILEMKSYTEENDWSDKISWIYNIYSFMQKFGMNIPAINLTNKFQNQLNEAVKLLREGQSMESFKRFQSVYNDTNLMKQDWDLLSEKRFEYQINELKGHYDDEGLDFQLFDKATLLNYLGLSHWSQNNYQEALEYFKLSHDQRNNLELVHYKDLTETLENIGSMYYYFNDPETSLYYYEQVLDTLRESDVYESNQLTRLYLNIGKSYLVVKKLGRAKEYVEKALEHVAEEDERGLLEIQLFRAEIYLQEGDLENLILELKLSLHNPAAQSNLIQLTYIQYKLILYYNALEAYHEIPALLDSLSIISHSYPNELNYEIKYLMGFIVTSLVTRDFKISEKIYRMISIVSTCAFSHELQLHAILLLTKIVIHTISNSDIDLVDNKGGTIDPNVLMFLELPSNMLIIKIIQLLSKSVIDLLLGKLESLQDNLYQLSHLIFMHQENNIILQIRSFLNICNHHLPDFNSQELKEEILRLMDDLLYNWIREVMWTGIFYNP
ncbi:MAG: hypothetical protein HeimC2_24650 [Candidatus Heimdallarchaeota archaeon LC_2]|nr:MAG: hypothetical protein HeimC2_24650 [Candidatus Heimdallarchaeota archaeon LC_2]